MSTELTDIARRLADSLVANGQVLATAESCTGGWVGQVVTGIAGSSAWYDRGFITYSNEAKQEMLGVPPETIREHGAVSTVTAEAMARGALSHSRATIALAITGVAGPSGGTVRNPVGTVCFAWANRRRSAGSKLESLHNRLWEDITCESVRLWFNGGREEVRRQAVRTALEGALKCSRS